MSVSWICADWRFIRLVLIYGEFIVFAKDYFLFLAGLVLMYIALVGIVMNCVLAGVSCRFFMRGVVTISPRSAWIGLDLCGFV